MPNKIEKAFSTNRVTKDIKQTEPIPPQEGISKIKARWQAWNTSRDLSSTHRQKLKLESLQVLAKELASGDGVLLDKVDFATQEFFKRGQHLGNNSVQNLLNHYCNFVEEFSGDLETLADDKLTSNIWHSS